MLHQNQYGPRCKFPRTFTQDLLLAESAHTQTRTTATNKMALLASLTAAAAAAAAAVYIEKNASSSGKGTETASEPQGSSVNDSSSEVDETIIH